MIQISKEEYDVIKKILIDGTKEAHVTITDGERKAVIVMEDAYEEEVKKEKKRPYAIKCIDNAGAEDQLIVGNEYKASIVEGQGRNMYEIVNEKGLVGKYEMNRFK